MNQKVKSTEVVTVPKWALSNLLRAVRGPDYLIRELQAISRIQGNECPITALEKVCSIPQNPSNKQTYNIRISDKQRGLLIAALKMYDSYPDYSADSREENLLVGMLQNAEAEGVLNDFTT